MKMAQQRPVIVLQSLHKNLILLIIKGSVILLDSVTRPGQLQLSRHLWEHFEQTHQPLVSDVVTNLPSAKNRRADIQTLTSRKRIQGSNSPFRFHT